MKIDILTIDIFYDSKVGVQSGIKSPLKPEWKLKHNGPKSETFLAVFGSVFLHVWFTVVFDSFEAWWNFRVGLYIIKVG